MESYTESTVALGVIEPSVPFTASDQPVATGIVYVHVHALTGEVFVSAKSLSGTCYYLRDNPLSGATTYAGSAACAVADTLTFGPAW